MSMNAAISAEAKKEGKPMPNKNPRTRLLLLYDSGPE